MCLKMTLINKIIMKLYVAPGISISSKQITQTDWYGQQCSHLVMGLWSCQHSGICCFFIPTRNTGVPQGGVTNPFLYCLFTQDLFMALYLIVEFDNDTAVTDLIRDEDESAHTEEVDRSALWCEESLLLSTNKTKEIIINLLTPTHSYQQRGSREWTSFKFYGIHSSGPRQVNY